VLRLVATIAVLITLGSCSGEKERLEGDGLIVLEGATLIDGTGSDPRPSSVVVIQGQKILRVGPMGAFSYPPGARLLDVSDKWIVPGFVDTHAHMPEPEDQAAVLKTLVAFGITSVRNPGAVPSAVELRSRIERGEIVGPRLVTAGNLIDAPGGIFSGDPGATEVRTEQEVRAEVRRQVAEGVDWIKVYRGLSPDLVQAAIDEAHRLGRPVLGHLGNTTWGEAARLGIDGLSHFGIAGTPWELVPEEDRAEVLRACRERDSAAGFLRLRATVSVAEEKTHEWARLLASRQVSVEPNLVLLQAVLWGNDAEVLEALEPQYAPATWRGGFWFDAVPHPYSGPGKSEWTEEAQATYPLFEELVLLLHDEGVVLTVGSDLMNPWMTPGVSYHRELELLVAAGIEPADVLVAATRAGAVALGLQTETGTLRQGMAADLVILGASPLTEIRNTRKIESVFLRGVQYRPSDLLVHQ
jgi:imidazolonepropionase-like amidohydrolase